MNYNIINEYFIYKNIKLKKNNNLYNDYLLLILSTGL